MLPHPRHPCRSAPAPPTTLSECSRTPDILVRSLPRSRHSCQKAPRHPGGRHVETSRAKPPAAKTVHLLRLVDTGARVVRRSKPFRLSECSRTPDILVEVLPHPRHPCRSAPAPPTPLSTCSQTPDPLLLPAGNTPHALPKISKPETSGPVFRNSSPQPPAPLHHWQASSALLLLCVTVSSVLLLKPWAQMPYTWPRASPRRDQRYRSSEVAPRDISRPNAAMPRAHLRTATSQLKASTRLATSDLPMRRPMRRPTRQSIRCRHGGTTGQPRSRCSPLVLQLLEAYEARGVQTIVRDQARISLGLGGGPGKGHGGPKN